jgi:molybdenum cofactor synthesis domain-containing protein
MDVALVTVGDELLVGDTTNTNMAWLGRQLTERGATVRRGLVLPDDLDVIADAVAALADTHDAVVVTGGIGPTHDDITMDAVAAAFDREMVEHEDAVAYFHDHDAYAFDELTARTAHLPDGARLLVNPTGVAPGAVVENVYVLPGVPSEMRGVFGEIADEFTGTRVHVAVVETDLPESQLLEYLADVQDEFAVRVGSYPGDGVRIKVRSTDESAVEQAAAWLRARV